MGIRFVFGRAGSGKSYYCLNQIKKKLTNDKNNKLIMLVPDQYTFQTEKKLLEYVGEKSLLRAEVLSFKRMATRVFDKCGGRAVNVIEDSGKNMLIYKLLKDKGEELQYFNRISKQQGFVGIVSKSITEFKKYNISEEILKEKELELEMQFCVENPFMKEIFEFCRKKNKEIVLISDMYLRENLACHLRNIDQNIQGNDAI